MFGHNDQQPHDSGNQPAPDGALDNQSTSTPPANDTAGEYLEDDGPVSGPTIMQPDNTNAAATDDGSSITSNAPTLPEPTTAPTPAPAADDDLTAPAPVTTASAPVAAPPADTDQLLNIKQQALQQLTPLVDHLEQTPEEKFRTTMMMIQAADNHALIQTAYEAAQQIQDEKIRAQALLDIVNEINYFTHNNSDTAAA